jgi:uncharacterized membrane protein
MGEQFAADRHVDEVLEQYEAKVSRRLNEDFARSATRGDRFADRVAARVGSWSFIGVQSSFLAAWILWNLLASPALRFDPAPFIGMNLLLSFQAAYTAPFIMMSANRMQHREHMEAEIDFAVNYFAEAQITDMQRDLHDLKGQVADLQEQNRHLAEQNARLLDLLQGLANQAR